MTGEQLETFIDMLYSLLEDFQERYPEHRNDINEKLHILTVLDKVSGDERDDYYEEEMSKNMTAYALSNINKIILGSPGTKHIDYSPMHGMIAKYGLKLSNVCEYLGITSNVRTSISKNETVHMDILVQISDFLECDPNDLFTFIDSQEKSKRELKELMVRESKTVDFKGKENPIPSTILKELRDAGNSDKITSVEHFITKHSFSKHSNNLVSLDKDDWITLNKEHSISKSEMNHMIENFIFNAIKNFESKQKKDNKNKED